MRFLIISDIHGNSHGLQAVLEHAQGQWDRGLCLGDVVGYGAHPNECCEIMRDLKMDCVMGNHDAAVLGNISLDKFNENAAVAIHWTKDRITKDNWAWLNWLPATRNYQTEQTDSQPFVATHGSLVEPFYEEYILTTIEAENSFDLMECSLCFYGHTHRAGYFRAPEQLGPQDAVEVVRLPEGGELEIEKSGWRYLVNPGSCGQPRDGNPQARYALLDTKSRLIQVKVTDYDVESARREILKAGLPVLFGDRLLEAW